MNCWKTALRGLWLLVAGWACWVATEGAAWAAGAGEPVTEKGSARDWVLPYFIVILCIALGMLVVCRTARRSERARPEKYEQLKTAD